MSSQEERREHWAAVASTGGLIFILMAMWLAFCVFSEPAYVYAIRGLLS